MPDVGGRGSRLVLSELIFLGLVVLVVWVGSEGSSTSSASPWFTGSVMGVPVYYLLFAGLLLLVLPYVVYTGHFPFTARLKGAGLWTWVALGWSVLCFAVAVALIRGVPELFADWRNLLVFAVVSVMVAKWVSNQNWRSVVLVDLSITLGLLCVPIVGGYAAGFGSSVGGVRTTVFDGTTLYLASFAAIGGAWYLMNHQRWMGSLRLALLAIATTAGSLVVLLSLRRSFWVVWGVGVMTLVIAYLRSKSVSGVRFYLASVGGVLVVLIAFLSLGTETILQRLESFSPDSSGRFSATNEDHLNDVIDAWRIVEEDPILGLGIGRRYETNLISDWKVESFEVHSAVVHVWLKFGLLGAITYVGFHIAFARHALRTRPMAIPIGAYIVGVMVATIVGTWPYGRFQLAVFHGILLGLLLVQSDQLTAQAPLSTREQIRLPAGSA